ncbi:unnamed protein product [Effrenium voratum]|uniref:Uncharacterized protein n=1 Tax=Effrenium voratum TaxID=2562239 RepID=A0AA36N704_9DINO|nr:unnamed protein product [Effrenium voratum]CAJ1441161.1 unnamed protein product [Effrenium voratum]
MAATLARLKTWWRSKSADGDDAETDQQMTMMWEVANIKVEPPSKKDPVRPSKVPVLQDLPTEPTDISYPPRAEPAWTSAADDGEIEVQVSRSRSRKSTVEGGLTPWSDEADEDAVGLRRPSVLWMDYVINNEAERRFQGNCVAAMRPRRQFRDRPEHMRRQDLIKEVKHPDLVKLCQVAARRRGEVDPSLEMTKANISHMDITV